MNYLESCTSQFSKGNDKKNDFNWSRCHSNKHTAANTLAESITLSTRGERIDPNIDSIDNNGSMLNYKNYLKLFVLTVAFLLFKACSTLKQTLIQSALETGTITFQVSKKMIGVFCCVS